MIVKKTFVMNYFNTEQSEWVIEVRRDKTNPTIVYVELTTKGVSALNKTVRFQTTKSDKEIVASCNAIFQKYDKQFEKAGLLTKMVGLSKLAKELQRSIGTPIKEKGGKDLNGKKTDK